MGQDLVVLEQEIDRLERSIQTFLDFARPPQPEKRLLDLSVLVQQVVALLSARAEHLGIRLECRLPDRPTPVLADAGQIRQVLLNLLLNALDATPTGGTVAVELEKTADGRELLLRVADTGPGLPATLGESIFEAFVSTKEAGLGLGLTICKRIVEAHDGAITAANRPQGGAAFTVRLPLPAE
jgi:signal transduction histidine kinase